MFERKRKNQRKDNVLRLSFVIHYIISLHMCHWCRLYLQLSRLHCVWEKVYNSCRQLRVIISYCGCLVFIFHNTSKLLRIFHVSIIISKAVYLTYARKKIFSLPCLPLISIASFLKELSSWPCINKCTNMAWHE